MAGRTWKWETISGLAAIALLGVLALPTFAGDTIPVQAILVSDCLTPSAGTGCQTDIGLWNPVDVFTSVSSWGEYSLKPGSTNGGLTDVSNGDGDDGVYVPGPGVESNILTHNTVFTLNTLATLDPLTGAVIPGTVTVTMHFYNYLNGQLPDCWGSPTPPGTWTDTQSGKTYNIFTIDVTQAVNWSIFSSNSTAFPEMAIYNPADPKTVYPGFARLDFNVRNGSVCQNNIYRYYLKWQLANRKTAGGGGITIKRLAEGQWEVTTDQYGTASLFGQGGRKGETQSYGDWRMPFKIILTHPVP